jgi:hypothetical protein
VLVETSVRKTLGLKDHRVVGVEEAGGGLSRTSS